MTTTTSTSTSTGTSTGAIKTATQQLLTSLGTGSGVDTASLVTSLVAADFAARGDALAAKASALTSQISGVASLKSTMAGFAGALDGLVAGGTLATQPVSSNPAALTATALPGAKLAGLSSTITVAQLAGAQSARTATPVASRTATIGSGSFTLNVGTATYAADGGFTVGSAAPVTIDVTDASLDGIAAAINAKGAGVTASVVTDADGGAYLSMKGRTGAAQAFTLAATTDPSGNLAQFAVGPSTGGTILSSTAQNAKLTVDGIAVERAGNTISDLVTGVKLQLAAPSAGAVSLTSASPAAALSSAVSNFVDTYNQVLAAVQAQTGATGSLKGDAAAQALLRSLKGLTSQVILAGADAEANGPTRLSELGVATDKDGTLRVDAATLTRQLATFPRSVEAMFAPSATGASGIAAALDKLAAAAASGTVGLGASSARYTKAQAAVSTQQDALSTARDKETTRLTQQYAAMNSKVAAYKATQTFLTNQVAAWNKSDG